MGTGRRVGIVTPHPLHLDIFLLGTMALQTIPPERLLLFSRDSCSLPLVHILPLCTLASYTFFILTPRDSNPTLSPASCPLSIACDC